MLQKNIYGAWSTTYSWERSSRKNFVSSWILNWFTVALRSPSRKARLNVATGHWDLSKTTLVKWVRTVSTGQNKLLLINFLNIDPKEVIAHKTPFEIYFARKCNKLRESGLQEECLPSPGKIRPTENDRKLRSRQSSKVRKPAQKAAERCVKRAQRTQLRLNPPSVYSVVETVYLRLKGRSFNKRHITAWGSYRRKKHQVAYL